MVSALLLFCCVADRSKSVLVPNKNGAFSKGEWLTGRRRTTKKKSCPVTAITQRRHGSGGDAFGGYKIMTIIICNLCRTVRISSFKIYAHKVTLKQFCFSSQWKRIIFQRGMTDRSRKNNQKKSCPMIAITQRRHGGGGDAFGGYKMMTIIICNLCRTARISSFKIYAHKVRRCRCFNQQSHRGFQIL